MIRFVASLTSVARSRAAWLTLLLVAVSASGCIGGGGGDSDEARLTNDPGPTQSGEDIRNALEGWVLNAEGLGVAEATVTLINAGDATTTTAQGRYQFVNLAPGDHLVSAQKSGFLSLTQRAFVRDGYNMILNFTLEDAPTQTPYDTLETETGQVSCYTYLGTDPETASKQDCGEVDPNNKASHVFDIAPGAAQLQIQGYWTPTTTLAQHLTMRVETVGFGHQDVVFADAVGASGVKVFVNQVNMDKFYTNGGQLRVTMYAGPSIAGDESPADVGAAIMQGFEIDLTTFFVEPGPSNYSSRQDGS